jgi:3',5'-cyclic AMP phosphodiesterase CpdA
MSEHPGRLLFSYAVVTDTHLNQGETECNSPFEVNKLANARMRHVVRELNRRDVEFVIHLGDLLHPVPAIPHLYERAANCFKEQIAKLRHPIYLIPGNHDVGDKPIDWGPAGIVRDEFLALWNTHFGANYQAFDHGDCRFILLDAQIINSGLDAEARQRDWLEAELAANEDKRIFLNIHYPPYLTYADEDEHYDNLGEPGRSWLLELMQRYRVEALFAGHVHNFWYHRHEGTHCYLLPSTAFVRQDYAEMYRVAPGAEMEYGRNDAAKLGFFIVHVHEHGHLCEVVRTYGALAPADSALERSPDRVTPVHPACNPLDRFGLDMRQNWLEVVEIPPSGGLDEFDRKRTRNDYSLMALLEMGVPRLRIPARDLLDPAHRARLDDCRAQGLRFTLFSFGVPGPQLLDAVANAANLLDAWEIAHNFEQLGEVLSVASTVAKAAGIALYLSKLRSKDEMESGGEKYFHMINHGFTVENADEIAQLGALSGVAGVVFRVAGETSPWSTAREAAALCRAHGLRASLHVRMSLGNPGSQQADAHWVANRAAQALFAAAAHDDVHAYLDAFADIDRGYFARQGVVDRLYNPRPGFHALRNLNAVLAGGPSDQAPVHYGVAGDAGAMALRDAHGREYWLIDDITAPATASQATTGCVVDLLSGERTPSTIDADGAFTPPLRSAPSLWIPDA